MIIQRNKSDKVQGDSWMAACKGPLRAIVVEAPTRQGAMLACAEMLHAQEAEEYAYCESMSHAADVASGTYALDGDMG